MSRVVVMVVVVNNDDVASLLSVLLKLVVVSSVGGGGWSRLSGGNLSLGSLLTSSARLSVAGSGLYMNGRLESDLSSARSTIA